MANGRQPSCRPPDRAAALRTRPAVRQRDRRPDRQIRALRMAFGPARAADPRRRGRVVRRRGARAATTSATTSASCSSRSRGVRRTSSSSSSRSPTSAIWSPATRPSQGRLTVTCSSDQPPGRWQDDVLRRIYVGGRGVAVTHGFSLLCRCSFGFRPCHPRRRCHRRWPENSTTGQPVLTSTMGRRLQALDGSLGGGRH